MSSILEALKKAEKESPKVDFTPELTNVDTRKAVSRRARGTRVLHRVMILAVVLVVLGLGTWLALSNKDLVHRKTVLDQSGLTAMEKSPAQASRDPAVATLKPEPVHESAKETTSRLDSTAMEKSPAQASRDPAVATPKPEPIHEPPGERTLPPAGKKEVSPRIAGFQEAKPASKQEIKTEQPTAHAQESHPEDARFKLEAIVWAESPQSRFAVINGHILRIGGSLEGISITAIERDHVAARSRGREWRMRFIAE